MQKFASPGLLFCSVLKSSNNKISGAVGHSAALYEYLFFIPNEYTHNNDSQIPDILKGLHIGH